MLRYGLSIIGSSLQERNLRQWGTCILNPLARKIAGVGPSARLPILRITAGITTARNLYVQNCGSLLNLSLRAHNSSIRDRIHAWLKTAYGVETWSPELIKIDPHRMSNLSQIEGRLKYIDYDVPVTWAFQVLPQRPALLCRLRAQSVFHSTAAEIEAKPNLKAQTHTFEGAHSWMETGVQVLEASGWRPDSSLESDVNVEKSLPPREGKSRIYVAPHHPLENAQEASNATEDLGYQKRINGEGRGVHIAASAFFQDGVGASAAHIQIPGETPSIQIWMLGTDMVSDAPPSFVLEGSLLHALLIADTLTETSNDWFDYLRIQAGNWRSRRILQKWQTEGALSFDCDAAADIVKIWHKLHAKLQCPLIIQKLPRGYFVNKHDPHRTSETTEAELVHRAARDNYKHAIPFATLRRGERLARIPWTTQELKKHMKRRYYEDERKAIGLLAEEGSTACIGYCRLGLNRAVIKASMKSLQAKRQWQVCLASVICATRYKFFDEKEQLQSARCPNGCGCADSLEHMLECYALEPPDSAAPFQEKANFLRNLAIKVARNSRPIPTPFEAAVSGAEELSLTVTQQPASSMRTLPSMEGATKTNLPSSLGVSLVDVLEFDGEDAQS